MEFAVVWGKNLLGFELGSDVNGGREEEEEQEQQREEKESAPGVGRDSQKKKGHVQKLRKYPSSTIIYFCPKLIHVRYR